MKIVRKREGIDRVRGCFWGCDILTRKGVLGDVLGPMRCWVGRLAPVILALQ